VTRYNWVKTRLEVDKVLVTVVPVEPPGAKQAKHDAADVLQLTPLGAVRAATPARANKRVYLMEFACTGCAHRVAKESDGTNCARACCDGLGACRAGCTRGDQRNRECTARLRIEATVALAANGEVEVSVSSKHTVGGRMSHTPPGTAAVPPPLFGLRVDPATKRDLVSHARGKDTAADVVGELGTELRQQAARQPDSLPNSRYDPAPQVVAGVLERGARKRRGSAELGDWDRLNRLVTEVLIARGVVVYFQPFVVAQDCSVTGMLVLATEWSLRLGCRAVLAGTDAKHDTSAGLAYYSSTRVPTPFGNQPVTLWISPKENVLTLQTALQSSADAVPCDNPACDHSWVVVWKGSRYRRYRSCEERTFTCNIVCDKHGPSLAAISLANFARPLLDRFHGFQCNNEQLKKLQILEQPAGEVGWAFRLYTRSEDDTKAAVMRTSLMGHMLRRVLASPAPWTLDQAEKYIAYFENCWHKHATIRSAWIEGGRLHLPDDVVPATGGLERHHREIDERHFRCQMNRDVTSVAIAAAGFDCSGTAFKGILATAQQQYEKEAATGMPRKSAMDISRRIAHAKACHELLINGLTSFEARPAGGALVRAFSRDVVRRHAEPHHRDMTPFPSELQPMRELLSYGGAESFQRDGWYASNARYACECLRATYHGARSAAGLCKHSKYRKLCERVMAARDSGAAEAVYLEAEAALRALVWGREKTKPEAIRSAALYDAANPRGTGTRAELLQALAAEPSVPPTGKGTGLSTVDEADLLLEAADGAADAPEEVCACRFGASGDLGLVFEQREGGTVLLLGFSTLANGAPGPAEHSGDQLSAGARVSSVVSSMGEETIALSSDGQLQLRGAGPLQLRFTPQPLALAMDGAAAADSTSLNVGRPAARHAKFPSATAAKRPRIAKAGGAPARRGRKPHSSRAEDRLQVEALPPTASAAERVAAMLQQLEAQAEGAECIAPVDVAFPSYIP